MISCVVGLALALLPHGGNALPSGHLKIMMFYDYDLPRQRGFTNVISGDGASVSTIVQAHRQYPDMVGMPTLPNTIFDRAHHGLFPGWREATDSFVAIMAPLLANGTAVGVFLGERSAAPASHSPT